MVDLGALEAKQKELVAIGASIAANCQPCLEWHYSRACEAGASEEEIEEAIDIGEMVKETVMMNSRICIDMITKKTASENHEDNTDIG